MDWGEIVSRATEKLEVQGCPSTSRVTVTNVFGGRGHDFRVQDEAVNDAGGLLVIMMTIPSNEREYVQWRGRTGRNDRRGQFAVVLDRTAALVSANASAVETHKCKTAGAPDSHYDAGLIATLLKIRDKATGEAIEKNRKIILHGQRMNELCDAFYSEHPDKGDWPGSSAKEAMRDFIAKNRFSDSNVTEQDCAEFARKWIKRRRWSSSY